MNPEDFPKPFKPQGAFRQRPLYWAVYQNGGNLPDEPTALFINQIDAEEWIKSKTGRAGTVQVRSVEHGDLLIEEPIHVDYMIIWVDVTLGNKQETASQWNPRLGRITRWR